MVKPLAGISIAIEKLLIDLANRASNGSVVWSCALTGTPPFSSVGTQYSVTPSILHTPMLASFCFEIIGYDRDYYQRHQKPLSLCGLGIYGYYRIYLLTTTNITVDGLQIPGRIIRDGVQPNRISMFCDIARRMPAFPLRPFQRSWLPARQFLHPTRPRCVKRIRKSDELVKWDVLTLVLLVQPFESAFPIGP